MGKKININISVIIHTHNEKENIADCIKSARFLTDDIVIIDTESTDGTLAIAQLENVPIYSFKYSHYVEPSREFGIEKVQGEWLFIMDADERITEELGAEIKELINNTNKTHFKVPRKNIFAQTRWLRYGGWYPDYVIRLINKNFFKQWPKQIHSTPTITGDIGYLQQSLLHYFHPSLTQMVEKTAKYEDIESTLLYDAKRTVSTVIFFRKYLGELFRRLIKNMGFRDGTIGVIESIYQAYSKTITYLFLYEKYQKSRTL